MSLADDLRAAAKAGDAERVVTLVEGATEKERREANKAIGGRSGMPRESAAWRLAWVGTATAREATTWWFMFGEVPTEQLLRVVGARGKQFLDTLVRAFERDRFGSWPVIRGAVKQGLIGVPEPSAYARALVNGVRLRGSWWREDAVYAGLLADPELLEEDVWRIFEVDASQELAGSLVYERLDSPGMGRPVGNCWTYALTRLAADGRLDRPRLLDASLAALQRDFRASSVGWYAQLHEALEPTVEERLARLDTYLALLASPVALVAREGLTGLKALETHVPGEALARAAGPALTLRQKAIPLDVLRLIKRVAVRDADARPALLATAAEALGHERADVQESALALLESHGLDDRVRSVVLGLAEAVAPQVRGRVEALTGLALESGAAETLEPAKEPVRRRLTPADAARFYAPLEPVESVDDLIELAAALLEGQGSGDDAERFLDGVSRVWPERPDGFDRRTGGIVKRATELTQHLRGPAGRGGAELVAHVVLAWTTRQAPPRRATDSLLGFLGLRVIEVANRVRGGGKPRGLLAFPTHSGGWIDPAVLAARESGYGRLLNRPDPVDLQAARFRAGSFPPVRIEASLELRKRWTCGQTEPVVAPRVVELAPELRDLRERLVESKPQNAWARDSQVTSDALGLRWLLTVLPADPDPAYGIALGHAVGDRDGQAAYGHPELVLEHALDPHVPIGELGWQLVAAGLLGKPQEVKRAAVDVVVAAVSDGRFDVERLAAGLAWLVGNGVGKTSRLEQPLRDAGRVSPLHATQVARTVVAFAAACGTTPPGLVAPLSAAHELAVSTGLRIEGPAERAALERVAGEVSGTSKLGRAARGLLKAAG